MVTFSIDNPQLEKKYTKSELKRIILHFLQNELKEENVNLYEISVEDLPPKAKERLENIDSLEFVDF